MKFDNSNKLNKQDEEINIKKVLFLLLTNWYWLLLFGILGIGLAYTYLQFKKPVYSMSSTILIPEESKGFDMKDLFNVGLEQDYTKINNQIEIIKSSFTIKETLLRLNWRTSWFKKKAFLWTGIYKNEPCDVQEAPNFINPSGIKLYITPGADNFYTVSVDAKLSIKGELKEVNFESKGEFGHPFKNEYFNFTLLKKVDNQDSENNAFYFVFNDLKQSTRSYQDRLNVTLKDEMSDIVVCSIAGEEPRKECDFLNELVSVYIAQKMDLQNESQRRSLEFINAQLSGISDSLNIAGDKFTAFRSKNTVINLGEEGTMVMNNLKEIESEKAKSQIQLEYFQNVLSYLEDSGDLTKIVSPSVVGIQDAALNMLVVKLGDLYNRRQVISFSAKPNNPSLVLLDKELSQTRTRLNENLRNLIANATKSINGLKEQQNQINYQLNKLPAKEQQMINIQRQYNITNEIYNFLLQKRAETNIALASSISDVQVIETADPDMAKSIGLARMMILYFGLFLGVLIPSAVIFMVNTFDNRILTQDDIEKNTQLPIVGNIMHSNDHTDLTVFTDPKSNIAEAFRELRTNLEFMLTGKQSKVISIHSTNPGEGKSYNSINLGTILAMNDHKVLIVGTDMRKPKLHKIFKVDNNVGLSTCLIGYDTFKQAILSTPIDNLSILPSGPIPPNPAEILSKPAMKDLLEWARKEYDYIILDNAPVALVTDGIIVSRLSDLNIFVLRFGMSHKHQLELINQLSETKKVNNIGLIVNDIKASSLGNGYYKYYQYEAYKKSYYTDEETGNQTRRKKRHRA